MSSITSEDLLEVARLFVKDRTGLRRNVYVYPTHGAWVVRKEQDHEPFGVFDSRRAAVDNADGLMRRKEASAVIVYGQCRMIQEIIM